MSLKYVCIDQTKILCNPDFFYDLYIFINTENAVDLFTQIMVMLGYSQDDHCLDILDDIAKIFISLDEEHKKRVCLYLENFYNIVLNRHEKFTSNS